MNWVLYAYYFGPYWKTTFCREWLVYAQAVKFVKGCIYMYDGTIGYHYYVYNKSIRAKEQLNKYSHGPCELQEQVQKVANQGNLFVTLNTLLHNTHTQKGNGFF